MWRWRQQRCRFVHSVASLITFLPHHVLILNLNKVIERSPCWETNCRSFRQEIARLLWYLKVHRHGYKACYSNLNWDRINAFYSHPHRSHRPRGLISGSETARLLRLWVRIPQGAWISVCCGCCVLSGRGLWNGLIPCPEESYRLWCVVVCDLDTSWMRRPWPTGGCCAKNKQTNKQLPTLFLKSYLIILQYMPTSFAKNFPLRLSDHNF